MAFCSAVGAGGNHLVAATAGGRRLGDRENGHLFLRERDLRPVLEEFAALPDAERRPAIEDPATAAPPDRPVPTPPANGLVVRAFCTYLKAGDDGKPERARRFYYEENPDRWAAETQSDMLWLTEPEWRALVPAKREPGAEVEVPGPVRERFFGTIGIDYMEGSVNALPVRTSSMTLTVERADAGGVTLRVEGHGTMGAPLGDHPGSEPRPDSRGCELRITGRLHFDAGTDRFDRFDIAGIGRAWGSKMEYTRREIRIPESPWLYGIACELVTTDRAIDRIPPYNLLHYGSAVPYFGKP